MLTAVLKIIFCVFYYNFRHSFVRYAQWKVTDKRNIQWSNNDS